MFCQFCGKENDDGATFCVECGQRTTTAPEAIINAPVQVQPLIGAPEQAESSLIDTSNHEIKPRKKLSIVVIASVFFIVAFSCFVIFVLYPEKKKEADDKPAAAVSETTDAPEVTSTAPLMPQTIAVTYKDANLNAKSVYMALNNEITKVLVNGGEYTPPDGVATVKKYADTGSDVEKFLGDKWEGSKYVVVYADGKLIRVYWSATDKAGKDIVGSYPTVIDEAKPQTMSIRECVGKVKLEAEADNPDSKYPIKLLTDEIGTLENKTIRIMASYDMLAQRRKTIDDEFDVFEKQFGATAEVSVVNWITRYESLATAITGGDGIDLFATGEIDAFPQGAIRDWYMPVDEYINFDSELWKDVKPLNDQFVWKNNHYLVATSAFGDNCVVLYNRDTIKKHGLDDPADLYKAGKWDWFAFKELLTKYCDAENELYGIDGYWCESALSKTTGVAYIGLQDGALKNNLRDPSLERVQSFMQKLFKDGNVLNKAKFDWQEQPSFMGAGKELFYPCGLWALYKDKSQWSNTFGNNVFFVPMPKDPEADAYYVPSDVEGYFMCKGAANPEGAAAFAACKRYVNINGNSEKIINEKLTEEYGWSKEMLSMKAECDKLAVKHPVFDFYYGINNDITNILDSSESGIRTAFASGKEWKITVDDVYAVIDVFLQDINS